MVPWGPPAPLGSASDGDASYSTARDSPATAGGWRDKQRAMVRKKNRDGAILTIIQLLQPDRKHTLVGASCLDPRP